MKVSLITIWHVGNYGAELQTYCTVQILKSLGHDVKVVDLRIEEVNKKLPSNFVKKVVTIILDKVNLTTFKNILFWKLYIPSTKKYKSLKHIKNDPPSADLYMVGSDQVWNTTITKQLAEFYFLNFGKTDVIRASYASSFGEEKWNGSEELTAIAEKQLKTFKKISCREESGVVILKKTFHVDAVNVLDPTLLLLDYKKLIGSPRQRKSLAYYPLTRNDATFSFCVNLASKLGLRVELANKTQFVTWRYLWNRNSIKQWLETICCSELVVTPSFHGITTSIVLRKNFIVIITEPEILKRSTRITDLLTKLGLMDHFFTDYDTVWKSKIWEKSIDYKAVEMKLSSLRDESLAYLKSVFER